MWQFYLKLTVTVIPCARSSQCQSVRHTRWPNGNYGGGVQWGTNGGNPPVRRPVPQREVLRVTRHSCHPELPHNFQIFSSVISEGSFGKPHVSYVKGKGTDHDIQ